MKEIILASGSPRRKQLLELAGIPFKVVVKETDESSPSGLSVSEIAIHIARNKALAVRDSSNISQTILAADTIVVIDSHVLGKPTDRDDAIRILRLLSGRTHQVITGVCILRGDNENTFHEITDVTFKPLSSYQIEYYIDTFKPYDKAGAYAIQEWIGVIGINSIKGDYYNVMGLPINRIFDIPDINR
ncbi:MAG: Maf-like protein [Ginsengibacter sp.]